MDGSHQQGHRCAEPEPNGLFLLSLVLRITDDRTLLPGQTIKNGWLEKKGQKRYFVIKNGKLLWFNKMQKDDSAEANGYLLLESCTVEVLPPANGKYALRITSLMAKLKREYTLTATSETECNDWVSIPFSGEC